MLMPRPSSTNCLSYNTAVTGQYHWQALQIFIHEKQYLLIAYPSEFRRCTFNTVFLSLAAPLATLQMYKKIAFESLVYY